MEEVHESSELLEWFRQDRQVYIGSKEEDYEKIKNTFEMPIHVIERQWVRNRYMMLLSNRPEVSGSREDHGLAATPRPGA